MSLAAARASFAGRVSEVRSVHQHIANIESALGRAEPTVEYLSLKGLFFVHLYGAFEHAVNLGVQEFLRDVRDISVRYFHLTSRAYLYALDASFNSISSGNGKKVFGKRVEFLDRQFSGAAVDMADTIFNMSLQNIGAGDFEDLFVWLDIKADPFPSAIRSLRGYLDEIVEKRRKVAHGREAASTVGQGSNAADLIVRIAAIENIVEHLFSSLEAHLAAKEFIASAHRTAYA